MKRRLFLTGPIGCGKSTAITQALGDKSTRCGGFLTRRHREPHLHFTLESPDGQYSETFLDFPDGKPRLNMDAFSQLGVSLLSGNILVLDEIGGIELLCPDFAAALMQVLQRDIPVIGVMKGEDPAGALIDTLGLSDAYRHASDCLRSQLRNDGNTLLYECRQFDEQALRLAEQWVKEYAHE